MSVRMLREFAVLSEKQSFVSDTCVCQLTTAWDTSCRPSSSLYVHPHTQDIHINLHVKKNKPQELKKNHVCIYHLFNNLKRTALFSVVTISGQRCSKRVSLTTNLKHSLKCSFPGSSSQTHPLGSLGKGKEFASLKFQAVLILNKAEELCSREVGQKLQKPINTTAQQTRHCAC